MIMDLEIISNSPEETIKLGRKIGAQLKGGEIIGFVGPLGSGKTCLIKGIAAGAGAAELQKVNSPTFVIINEYRSGDRGLDIYHIDAYRLDSISKFETIGFDDYCYRQAVILVEWADKVETALKNVDLIKIELSHWGPNKRKIHSCNMPNYIST